jgi:hypothetical protein
LYNSPSIIWMIKLRRMRWVEPVSLSEDNFRNSHKTCLLTVRHTVRQKRSFLAIPTRWNNFVPSFYMVNYDVLCKYRLIQESEPFVRKNPAQLPLCCNSKLLPYYPTRSTCLLPVKLYTVVTHIIYISGCTELGEQISWHIFHSVL